MWSCSVHTHILEFVQDGTTALMYASLSGQTEAVKLLSAKAVIDLQNRVSTYS